MDIFSQVIAVINSGIQLIAPKRPDAELVDQLTTDTILSKMNARSSGTVTHLFSFADPSVRALIHEIKFHRNQTALQLAQMAVREHLRQFEKVTLIPIPLSPQRHRERGYNQVTLIAKEVAAQHPSVTVADTILTKTKETVPQTTLNKKERQTNVRGVFAVNKTITLDKTAKIILLDDVTTTGATLAEARATLAPAYPTITCLALAH